MRELIHLWKCVCCFKFATNVDCRVITRFSSTCYEYFSISISSYFRYLILVNVAITFSNYTSLDNLYIHCRMIVILNKLYYLTCRSIGIVIYFLFLMTMIKRYDNNRMRLIIIEIQLLL